MAGKKFIVRGAIAGLIAVALSGCVSVPDAIIEKALAKLKSQPARKTELLIPGSKTFLDKQAGTHDPAESAFLTQ